MKKPERNAIAAVARRVSATWEQGSDRPDAYLTVAGKRVAVDVRSLKPRRFGQGYAAKPRLRLDKVVTSVMGRLQAALGETIPDGTTVVVTITAPIRLASKTAAALEEKIQSLLGRRSPAQDVKATVHGNRIRIQLLRCEPGFAPRLIGFVHNSDTDPLRLFNMTRDLLGLMSAEAGRRPPRPACERWLVAISPETSSCLEAYRYICTQLTTPPVFKEILMVFSDGRVEPLGHSSRSSRGQRDR